MPTTGSAVTIGSLVSDTGSLVTGALSWASTAVTFITSNPLVLLFCLVGFVGLGVGLVKRFIR